MLTCLLCYTDNAHLLLCHTDNAHLSIVLHRQCSPVYYVTATMLTCLLCHTDNTHLSIVSLCHVYCVAEYSLVLPRCVHQADPSLLRVAETLRDSLVKEGDRVDVKIKEADHVTPRDGVLLIIGTHDKIKQSLQQLHLGKIPK